MSKQCVTCNAIFYPVDGRQKRCNPCREAQGIAPGEMVSETLRPGGTETPPSKPDPKVMAQELIEYARSKREASGNNNNGHYQPLVKLADVPGPKTGNAEARDWRDDVIEMVERHYDILCQMARGCARPEHPDEQAARLRWLQEIFDGYRQNLAQAVQKGKGLL